MNGLGLKEKLRAGEFCRGAWVSIPNTATADTMAHAGFDFIIFESEHAPITMDHIEMMSVLFRHAPATPIVRVGWNDQVEIKRVLDSGAEGLVIPMVNTAEEARRAVSYAKYPPAGVRGWAPRAAADFGRSATEYLRTANDRIVVMPQVEHIDAVKNLDAILDVPGIDVLFVGPSDLSASMGLLGQQEHTDVQAAIDTVLKKAAAAKVPVATVSRTPEEAIALAGRGFQLLTLGSDLSFAATAARDALARVTKDSFRPAG